jgi:hypothetical protein
MHTEHMKYTQEELPCCNSIGKENIFTATSRPKCLNLSEKVRHTNDTNNSFGCSQMNYTENEFNLQKHNPLFYLSFNKIGGTGKVLISNFFNCIIIKTV